MEEKLQKARDESIKVFPIHLYKDKHGILKELFQNERAEFIKDFIANYDKKALLFSRCDMLSFANKCSPDYDIDDDHLNNWIKGLEL